VPSLPRARIHVGATQLQHAQHPGLKDRASYRPPELDLAGAPETRRLPDRGEVLPDLHAWRSDGHTAGLLVLEVHAAGQRVVFPTDLLPTALHARPAWGMAYDNLPLTVIDEKLALMQAAADDGAIIASYHDARTAAFRLQRHDARWDVVPVAI
jgi:glyoxylase-like metal-dependent hydrolase (beta-lactamase superfamily II)